MATSACIDRANYEEILFHRRKRPLVEERTRRKLFQGVVLGHLLTLAVPMSIGILIGMWESEKQQRIVVEIYDPGFSAPAATSPGPTLPGPPAPPTPNVPAPPTPPAPNVPAPPTPPAPRVPAPPAPSAPRVPTPPVPAVAPTPPRNATPAPTPPRNATPAPTPPRNATPAPPRNNVHNDNWSANNLNPVTPPGNPGGGSRVAGGDSQSTTSYDGDLRRYIDMMWDDAPTEAPPEFYNCEVVVTIDIAADGTIRSWKMEESGYKPLDESVKRLFQRMRRVPPPGERIPKKVIRLGIQVS